MPDGVTRAEYAELLAQMRGVNVALAELRPLLLERSRDELRLANIERDLGASHDKHRQHFQAIADLKEDGRQQRETLRTDLLAQLAVQGERLDRVENRQKRVLYGLAALAAVIEVLARGGAAIEFLGGLF